VIRLATIAALICTLAGVTVETASADPSTPKNFDGYAPVNMADFHTYDTYGWAAIQFRTANGIRCRIPSGARSFQYSAYAECWGNLPGVPPGVNTAIVSPQPYFKATLTPVETGPVAPDATVLSLFRYSDLSDLEMYYEMGKGRLTAAVCISR
jgi:hypothetical protein